MADAIHYLRALKNDTPSATATFEDEHMLACSAIAIHFAACGIIAWATNSWLFWLAVGVPALLFPMYLAICYPAAFLTRLAVAAACMTFVLLGVEQTSGFSEAHFSFFVMITVLAVYRDWRVLIFAAALVVVHHVGFTIVDPRAIGFYERSDDFAPWRHVASHLSVGLLQVFTLCYLAVLLRRREALSVALGDSLDLARERAARDPLTGLFNRNYLEEVIDRFWHLDATRRLQSVLCVIDIDHFKKINDRYGHACGDEVLRAIAKTIASQSRPSDFAFRYGGEEFIVLLPNSTLEDGCRFAEDLRTHVAASPFNAAESALNVTVSIGLAASQPLETFDDLFKRADQALLRAKRQGRNRVEAWSDFSSGKAA